MKYIILFIAILFGTPTFIGGIILYPDVVRVLDKESNAPFQSYINLMEILSVTLFIALVGASFASKIIKVNGFDLNMAFYISKIATLPIIFFGPITVISFIIDGKIEQIWPPIIATVLAAFFNYKINSLFKKSAQQVDAPEPGTSA